MGIGISCYLLCCWPRNDWTSTDVREIDLGQRAVVLLGLVGCRCFVMALDTMRSCACMSRRPRLLGVGSSLGCSRALCVNLSSSFRLGE